MGFAMTTNEAILYLAIGFMVIIGIWLTALTYMVLKRHRDITEKTEKTSEKLEEEIAEEEVSEPEPTPKEEELEPQEPAEEEKGD